MTRRRRRASNTWTVVRIPEQPLHERVLELAAPLLERPGSALTPEAVRSAIELAITFWNAKAQASKFWGRAEEASRRVVEARLRLSSLECDVHDVWHLRHQLVERERRDQTEHALRDALGYRDEVRVGERIERGEAVHPSGDGFDDASVAHGVERPPVDGQAHCFGHA